MSITKTNFKGNVKIKGRPREQARAEIMLMKQREAYEGRQRRRRFFTFLDIIAIIAFLGGLYSIYKGSIMNGLLMIAVGLIIISYFLMRKISKNKTSKKNNQ